MESTITAFFGTIIMSLSVVRGYVQQIHGFPGRGGSKRQTKDQNLTKMSETSEGIGLKPFFIGKPWEIAFGNFYILNGGQGYF